MDKNKQKLLGRVEKHMHSVIAKIKEKLEAAKGLANQSLKGFGKMLPEDQAVFMSLRGHAHKRVRELSHLEGSPYFTKCEVIDESGKHVDYFFAKHEFSEESIYSWVAPVSAIRFEDPGVVSFKLPNGVKRTVTIKQKETYMIVDGKIMFFALEAQGKSRQLIYQEHFTKQKSEFVLPEIVAQMEKAQDLVIRANHKGPLVISGPAGSGKTTLALHRVAYLTQVPDTAELYPAQSILVLVQDNGTKKYFSTLLPSLGINDVHIVTFSEWAFSILGIEDYSYGERYGETEEEKDVYEYQKLKSLREGKIASWNKNIFDVLKSQYLGFFGEVSVGLLSKQKKDAKLDRFDLVVLLRSCFAKHKKFEIRRQYNTFVKDKLVRKTEKTLIEYSLMIIDEFQNYLPEQLQILKNCLNTSTQSVVYVGDMAQQVKLGTIRNWDEIGEVVSPDRNVKLSKVYRNTKNILEFIKSLGYSVELPASLKEGPTVVEKRTETVEEEIEHIKAHINTYKNGSIGILAKDESYLEAFKKEFTGVKNVHVLTMLESQGVEFDYVCIVGISNEFFNIAHTTDISSIHIEERRRMQKDLLYVALTRAITELHILGSEPIKIDIARL